MKRTKWQVKKELEFEVEALDAAEANECACQFINAELMGRENGLGVEFKGQRQVETRRL